MFCKNCGNELDNGPNFCNYCGVSQIGEKTKTEAYNLGKILGAIGVFAATNAAVDNFLAKDREKFDEMMEKSNKSMDRINEYMRTGTWENKEDKKREIMNLKDIKKITK